MPITGATIRYALLGRAFGQALDDPKSFVQGLLDSCKIPPDGYLLGKSCLFLRESAYKQSLNDMHTKIQEKSVIVIQRAFRSYISRKRLKKSMRKKRLAEAGGSLSSKKGEG